jgi:heme-degrading monooxygenase HmoA
MEILESRGLRSHPNRTRPVGSLLSVPPLPWQRMREPKPDEELTALASHLPLKRLLRTPRFFRHVQAVRKQLRTAPGLVGYSLLARPLQKEYWTLSVWNDEAALMAFVQAQPHAGVMRALRPEMGATKFVRWPLTGVDTPPTWDDALRRLNAEPPAR